MRGLLRHGHEVEAMRADRALARGLATHGGALAPAPVAEAHGREHTRFGDVLG